MSSQSQPVPRILSDEELRELPQVVQKMKARLNLTQVLALILAALTIVSGTVALMQTGLIGYEHEQIQRIDKTNSAMDDRVTDLEKNVAHDAGGVEARLKGVEDSLKSLSDLLQRHMGLGGR